MGDNLAGRVVRERRLAAHMTLDQLRAATSYSLTYLGKIERGALVPPTSTLAKITVAIARHERRNAEIMRRSA